MSLEMSNVGRWVMYFSQASRDDKNEVIRQYILTRYEEPEHEKFIDWLRRQAEYELQKATDMELEEIRKKVFDTPI